jgi:pyruvate dehydrogenase E1 component alpha subunit
MASEPVQDAFSVEGVDVAALGTDLNLLQVIDADGLPVDADAEPALSEDELLEMYANLVLARRFDERAVSLQRQGRIATYAPMGGAEGLQVAATMALSDDDWLFPTYRDHAAKYGHGMSYASMLATLRGQANGFDVPEDVNVLPEYIPIASQLPQAVGAGMATDYRGEPDVHLVTLGDGATSEGDFHEALNFAGVFDAPVVFLCNNNQWAISVPTEKQTASETLAQKADAYGIPGVRVDGMDPLAVYDAVSEAVARARDTESDMPRATFIEGVTYRLGAHTTADDPDVYRDGVPEEWAARDPVPRLENYLRYRGILDDRRDAEIRQQVEDHLREAIQEAESWDDEEPDAMFEHVFAEETPELTRQRERLTSLREKLGDEAFEREE